MISDFRAELYDLVDNIPDSYIDKIYDFMPTEMREDSVFVIGDITDKSHDPRHGITQLLFTREVSVYCLVKIRDNNRAEAEERADGIAALVVDAFGDSTLSHNLQQRKSVGYTIAQYQYQGVEMLFEFYQVD